MHNFIWWLVEPWFRKTSYKDGRPTTLTGQMIENEMNKSKSATKLLCTLLPPRFVRRYGLGRYVFARGEELFPHCKYDRFHFVIEGYHSALRKRYSLQDFFGDFIKRRPIDISYAPYAVEKRGVFISVHRPVNVRHHLVKRCNCLWVVGSLLVLPGLLEATDYRIPIYLDPSSSPQMIAYYEEENRGVLFRNEEMDTWIQLSPYSEKYRLRIHHNVQLNPMIRTPFLKPGLLMHWAGNRKYWDHFHETILLDNRGIK